MSKQVVSAKISPKTEEQLEEWADDMGISKSEATNRLLDKALEVENNDDVIVQTDGGEIMTQVEAQQQQLEKIKTDGGKLMTQVEAQQQQLEKIKSETSEIGSQTDGLMFSVAAGFVWLLVKLTFGMGAALTISSGLVVLFLLLAYPYLRGKV